MGRDGEGLLGVEGVVGEVRGSPEPSEPNDPTLSIHCEKLESFRVVMISKMPIGQGVKSFPQQLPWTNKRLAEIMHACHI